MQLRDFEVLMRVRKDEVAVASNIRSIFHRVACREDDTDALRFLWWDGSLDEPPSDYKMTVHLFGKADSPCIAAWALQQTAADKEAAFGEYIREVDEKKFLCRRWFVLQAVDRTGSVFIIGTDENVTQREFSPDYLHFK